MVNVKNSALKIVFGNVGKISFYIPIYDNTQFILQSHYQIYCRLIFFATTTTLPFLWEYSQVDNVNNLSPKTAEIPVS